MDYSQDEIKEEPQIVMNDNQALKKFLSVGVGSKMAHAAYKIYSESGRHIGSNKKKRNFLLFTCMYNAYIRERIIVDPIELGKKFGVSEKLSLSSQENVYIDPSVYTGMYLSEIEQEYTLSSDFKAKIAELVEKIDNKPPPYTASLLGLAVISYYLDSEEWGEEEKKFLKRINFSSQKMKECMKTIRRLY